MQRATKKLKWSFALPAMTALLLGGCAIVGSAPTFVEAPGVAVGCRSGLGSYSLPKTVLNLRITRTPGKSEYFLQDIAPTRVPDNQHTFCLDYLRSPLSSDEVRVFKNKIIVQETPTTGEVELEKLTKRQVTKIAQESTPFLQLVASKAVDHTAGIIRRFIRTAFILLTNRGTFAPARSAVGVKDQNEVVVADFSVDPFDYQEMARVNEAVRKFGFCFVLEDYTFDRSPGTGLDPDQYCRAPYKSAAARPPLTAEPIKSLHYLVPKPIDGIYFRPRAAYRFSVFVRNEDRTWRLGHIKNLQMENIMPIVSVGVSRAIFATRRTGLVFLDGTLTNVCISKGSELESAVQIPLDVVYGIIALPSQTLLAAVNDATTAKELLQAQKRLVDAQNQYIRFLNKDKDASGTVSQTEEQKGKGGKLTIGSSVNTAAPIVDVNPDAGPIYSANGGDPLSEICAELAMTATKNPTGTAGALEDGSF